MGPIWQSVLIASFFDNQYSYWYSMIFANIQGCAISLIVLIEVTHNFTAFVSKYSIN